MKFIRQTKLQQLCLNVICENIEKYVYNDCVPEMHIYFLYQFYSNDVFERITYNQAIGISEEFMLWFLNPYTKIISLLTVSEKIIKRLNEMGPNISSLNLEKCDGTENMINSILCCVPNVTELNLKNTPCSDKTMLIIQRMCPKILHLNLEGCQKLTDQGMINLCGSHKCLEILNLKWTSITPAGISTILNGFPLLKILKKKGFAEIFYQIHELYLKTNMVKTCHYNITELIYEKIRHYKCNAQSVILLWINLCPNIEKVCLRYDANYYEIALCSKFRKLKYLEILSTNPIEATSKSKLLKDPLVISMLSGIVPQDGEKVLNILDPFTNLIDSKRLTTLILCYTEIPTKAFFECLTHLKTLELHQVTFSDYDEKYLKQQRQNNLDVLRLGFVDFELDISRKAIIKLLSVSQNVTELQFYSDREKTYEVFETILNSMQKLSYADFRYAFLDKLTALKFLQLPSLMILCLQGWIGMPCYQNFQGVVSDSFKSLAWIKWEE